MSRESPEGKLTRVEETVGRRVGHSSFGFAEDVWVLPVERGKVRSEGSAA